MKTYNVKAKELRPEWRVIDAAGRPLGRLATEVAGLLRGKHRPIFTPHLNTGDFVIVLNAAKVRVTGKKARDKIYYRHSQYPGGLKAITFEQLMAKRPTRVVEHAVKGMLPHNTLGSAMFRRLRVYPGETHPHQGQVTGLLPAVLPAAPAGPPVAESAAAKDTS